MTRRIWLVRHGESEANAGLRTLAQESVVLTERGRRQAEELSGLVDEPPSLIVTSPFIRTAQTAGPLIARFPAAAQTQWPIQEFTYLSPLVTANSTLNERRPYLEAWWARRDPHYRDHPETESFLDVLGRARDFLSRLDAAPQGLTVAFSHAQFMRLVRLIARHGDLPPHALMDEFRRDAARRPIENCAVMLFERE